MRGIADQRAIVAIDPTSEGLAWVYFEGGRLRDWRRSEAATGEIALLGRILEETGARVLVLEDATAPGARRCARVAALLDELARQARGQRLSVRLVARAAVRDGWRARGVRNKQQMAAAIANDFPELRSHVPPHRKNSMNEDSRVNIFDALSLLLHAFPARIIVR